MGTGLRLSLLTSVLSIFFQASLLIKFNTSSFVDGNHFSLAGPSTASLNVYGSPGSEVRVAENTTPATLSLTIILPSGSMTCGSIALSSVSNAKGL
jgi:hypothetical protein